MVTAAGDEKKYEEGLKILKQAAIGLVIIGLSWIIVSVVFWLIRGVTA
jgi:preprotein translocase subunit Sss1